MAFPNNKPKPDKPHISNHDAIQINLTKTHQKIQLPECDCEKETQPQAPSNQGILRWDRPICPDVKECGVERERPVGPMTHQTETGPGSRDRQQ